ncbi:hypothetical protein BD560DRAFT_414763 [Blakeslea trispora]|nr:hypothetical protein BD560DRAFT_414763 [Blakeslea trispora]
MIKEPDASKEMTANIQSKVNTSDSTNIRDPIKTSKAEIQTVYITNGYAWTQTDSAIILYINFEKANRISQLKCTVDVLLRSIELNILDHDRANHKFRINQLYYPVIEGKFILKFKENKIVLRLFKEVPGKKWPDLRIKSTQTIYNHLERLEKKYTTVQPNLDTLFQGSDLCTSCSNHSH